MGASDLKSAFERARYYHRRQWFVRAVIGLRLAFYNFGFELKAIKPADQVKVDGWWSAMANRQSVIAFVRDAWTERLITQNVISFWFDGGIRPLVLCPEEIVSFTDFMADEVLTIQHNMSAEAIDGNGLLSAAQKQKLKASSQLKLTHRDPYFRFEVLREEKAGKGLGWPALESVAEACGQSESLDVADTILATICRTVHEVHKSGHETRNGPMAGRTHNLDEKTAKAIERQFKGKTGHVRTIMNWDRTIDWLRPDAKHFEPKKFESVIDRLLWWSMPLGQIMTSTAYNAQWMSLFGVQGAQERAEMALHLEMVLNDAFQIPGRVRPCWSDACFVDARLFQELLKFGLTAGPVSQTTFLQACKLDPEKERDNKEAEAKLPKSKTWPLFDAAHGVNPAAPPVNNPGRKPGSPNTQ
jgi:hypothetical protein